MKNLTVIIIVLLSVICVSCKKTHCPAFPSDLNYFPYSQEQELKFVNSQQNFQYFTITSKENSKAESFEWNCRCECFVYTMFSANSNTDSLNIRCDIHVYGRSYGSNISMIFQIYSKSNDESIYKQITTDKSFPYEEMGQYIEDSVTLENDNNKLIKKVVFVKNKGLVSYTTADGEEWKLVE